MKSILPILCCGFLIGCVSTENKLIISCNELDRNDKWEKIQKPSTEKFTPREGEIIVWLMNQRGEIARCTSCNPDEGEASHMYYIDGKNDQEVVFKTCGKK